MADPNALDATSGAPQWVQAGAVSLFAFAVWWEIRTWPQKWSALGDKVDALRSDMKSALENLRFLTPPRGVPRVSTAADEDNNQ